MKNEKLAKRSYTYTWEDSGLVEGLSNDDKKLLSKLFNKAVKNYENFLDEDGRLRIILLPLIRKIFTAIFGIGPDHPDNLHRGMFLVRENPQLRKKIFNKINVDEILILCITTYKLKKSMEKYIKNIDAEAEYVCLIQSEFCSSFHKNTISKMIEKQKKSRTKEKSIELTKVTKQ